MNLTLHTDYAFRVLLYLGERNDRLCSISEISQVHGISYNHLMKVAHDLGKKGFISSVRGRSGGIRLSRPAYQINVGDVVRRMEGGEEELKLLDCPVCPMSLRCGLRGILDEALDAFLATLDTYTLCDMMKRSRGHRELFARVTGDNTA